MNHLRHSNAIEHYPCRAPLGHRLIVPVGLVLIGWTLFYCLTT